MSTLEHRILLGAKRIDPELSASLRELDRGERRLFNKNLKSLLGEQAAIAGYRDKKGKTYYGPDGELFIASTGEAPLVALPISLDLDLLSAEELHVLVDFNYLDYGTMTESQIALYESVANPKSKEFKQAKVSIARDVLQMIETGYQTDLNEMESAGVKTDPEHDGWSERIIHNRMAKKALESVS